MKSLVAAAVLLTCLTTAGYAQSNSPEDRAARAVVLAFSESRNAHDGRAAAETYAEEGEYISVDLERTQGRSELESLWDGVTGQADRVIKSVDLIAPTLAVVRVDAKFEGVTRVTEIFLIAKHDDKWQIQVHEAGRVPGVSQATPDGFIASANYAANSGDRPSPTAAAAERESVRDGK